MAVRTASSPSAAFVSAIDGDLTSYTTTGSPSPRSCDRGRGCPAQASTSRCRGTHPRPRRIQCMAPRPSGRRPPRRVHYTNAHPRRALTTIVAAARRGSTYLGPPSAFQLARQAPLDFDADRVSVPLRRPGEDPRDPAATRTASPRRPLPPASVLMERRLPETAGSDKLFRCGVHEGQKEAHGNILKKCYYIYL